MRNKYSSFAPPLCAKSFKGQVLDSFFKEQNNMIDILNHYTLGFDQDRHIEGFSSGIKCRACLAALSEKTHRNWWMRNLSK